MVVVVVVEKVDDFLNGISVHPFATGGWKAHRDDPLSDVGKIEVETVLHEPLLLLAHEVPKLVCKVSLERVGGWVGESRGTR